MNATHTVTETVEDLVIIDITHMTEAELNELLKYNPEEAAAAEAADFRFDPDSCLGCGLPLFGKKRLCIACREEEHIDHLGWGH